MLQPKNENSFTNHLFNLMSISYAGHKRRYFEECWCPKTLGTPLASIVHKTTETFLRISNFVFCRGKIHNRFKGTYSVPLTPVHKKIYMLPLKQKKLTFGPYCIALISLSLERFNATHHLKSALIKEEQSEYLNILSCYWPIFHVFSFTC